MKIAVIVSSTQLGGGAEQSAILLANGLSDEHEVDLLTFYQVEESYTNIATAHTCFGVSYRCGIRGKIWNMLVCIPMKLRKHSATTTYDLVIVNGADSILTWGLSGLSRSIKRCAVLRNAPAALPRWVWSFYLSMVRQAHHIVAISRGLLALHGLEEREDVEVIPNPIDIERYENDALDTKKKGKHLLFVGRLEAIKDPLYAVDIFHRLYRQDPSYRLTIVGDGSLYAHVQQRIVDLGLSDYITLVGRQHDIVPYLHETDALLLTSKAETFGRVLVEAMAAGLPIFAVNCPVGPAEILAGELHDALPKDKVTYGEWGVLLPVNDAEKSALAISKVCENSHLMKKYQQSSLERASMYDKDNVLQQWKTCIQTF